MKRRPNANVYCTVCDRDVHEVLRGVDKTLSATEVASEVDYDLKEVNEALTRLCGGTPWSGVKAHRTAACRYYTLD